MLVIGPQSFDALQFAAQGRAAMAEADRLERLGFAHVERPMLIQAWKRSDDVADRLGWTEQALTDRLARLLLIDTGRPDDLATAVAYTALARSCAEPDQILSLLERQLTPVDPRT